MLACDLIVTVFSDLPSLRLFGWLNPFAMLAPLAADLATFLSRLARQIGGKRWHQLEPGQYERLSGWIIPVAKGSGAYHVLPRDSS